jgi:hypothetical protein
VTVPKVQVPEALGGGVVVHETPLTVPDVVPSPQSIVAAYGPPQSADLIVFPTRGQETET